MTCRTYHFDSKNFIDQRRLAHARVTTNKNANSSRLFDVNGLPLTPEDILGQYRSSQLLDVVTEAKSFGIKEHVAIFVKYQVY